MGGGYYLYDTCARDLLALSKEDNRPHPEEAARAFTSRSSLAFPNTAGRYACGQERASTAWLNLPAVQEALHVHLVDKKRFDLFTALQYNFSLPVSWTTTG